MHVDIEGLTTKNIMAVNTTIYERWDQFMYLLSAQPRRQVITSLLENGEEEHLPLPDAAMTPEISTQPEQHAITLRNHHLPMLASADYIEWTSDPFRVSRGRRFEEPATVMDLLLSEGAQLSPALVSGCVGENS